MSTSKTKVMISPVKEPQSSFHQTSSTTLPLQQQDKLSYSVKVMNPGLKRDYSMHKFKATKFGSVDEIRDHLSNVLPCGFTHLGYIDPGCGLKGKQQWITQDDDSVEMYDKYGKHDILLWCLKKVDDQPGALNSKSKKNSASEGAPTAKRPKQSTSHYAETLTEVEELIKQLREKHGSLYSPEQLNCWAHMHQTKKHGSLETPPNLPYFRAAKRKWSSAVTNTQDTPSYPSFTPSGLSPSKRVTLRTECMKQLELWHSLLEKGGITKEQYDELQHTILDDIKENF